MIVLLSYHIVVFRIYLIVLCSFIFVILDDAEEQVHIYCSYDLIYSFFFFCHKISSIAIYKKNEAKNGINNRRKKVAHQFATELVSTELITTYQPTRFGRVNTECIHMHKPQDVLTLSLTDLIYIYIYSGEAEAKERENWVHHARIIF